MPYTLVSFNRFFLLPYPHNATGYAHRRLHQRTDKLAAECRVAVVYYRYGHFAYHLIGINKGIYQRVGQRDKQEENKYALVFENGFQFLLAYMEETCEALLYGLF